MSEAISFNVEVVEANLCRNCKAYHTEPRGGDCPITMGLDCVCCGDSVRALSTGGNSICPYCDTGLCKKLYGRCELETAP